MELVVLVDENNNQIGTAEKMAAHNQETPLHRGFSLFLFNSKNQILLTQRAQNKKTFPGIWSNTVCGHPAPNETITDSVKRRLKQELGITVFEVKEISPYRYRFTDSNGIVENEICPIFYTKCDAYPTLNTQEVANYKWLAWSAFLEEIANSPQDYTPWCREETVIVDKFLRDGKTRNQIIDNRLQNINIVRAIARTNIK